RHLAEAGVPGWQVWLTESGTNLEGNGSRPSVSKGFMAHSPEQEMILAEFAPKSAIRHQQGGIFRNWYFLFGCYNEQSGRRDWGTMRRDGTVKPIHASMATVASELGDAKLLGEKKFKAGVRAFVYVKPGGGRTLAYWRESAVDTARGGPLRLSEAPATEIEIAAPDGEYVNVDMMGTPGKISAAGGKLKLAADRFPQYLRGAGNLDADIAATDPGKLANYHPGADEDLSVVIRPETNAEDFDITGQKCIAELVKEKGRLRIEIWNLSGETKKGSLAVKGGTLEGIPEELVLAPWGRAALEAAYRPDPGDDTSFKLDISGVFNGRRATRVRIPVLYTWLFMRDCKSVGLDRLNRTDAWARNDSGQKFTCTRDEKENAVRFDVEWDGSGGAWFFPVAKLAEGESFENAKYLEFEVKSRQDKVENDMHLVQVMCLYRHAGCKNVPFKAPTFEWEKRRIALPSDPGDIHSFRVGCLPHGKRLEFCVRNFRILKAKK
ncbi:MAG TPA: hypothetical protein PKI32_09935, partial [Opitutales bacterium]|nr:hypothetical protein [Opitutales bacterium]